MDYSLIIFLVIIALFSYRGYRSGVLVIVSRIFSLLGAYLVAFLFTVTLARWIQSVSSIAGLLSYALAGFLLFVGTSTLLSLFFALLLRLVSNRETTTGSVSSIPGGLLGAVVGIVIGFVAVWFFSTMQALLNAKRELPPIQASQFQQAAKKLTNSAVKSLIGGVTEQEELATASAALLANPAENVERFQRLSQTGMLQNLFHNNAGRMALDSRNPNALMRLPAFQDLVNQPDFIALAKELKLPQDSSAMHKQVATKITTMWAQIKSVRNDPQFIAIIEDPEFKHMLQSGNVYQMLNNAKIETLLRVISSADVPELTHEEDSFKPSRKQVIHRWVDEKGVVHYSDEKPDEKN